MSHVLADFDSLVVLSRFYAESVPGVPTFSSSFVLSGPQQVIWAGPRCVLVALVYVSPTVAALIPNLSPLKSFTCTLMLIGPHGTGRLTLNPNASQPERHPSPAAASACDAASLHLPLSRSRVLQAVASHQQLIPSLPSLRGTPLTVPADCIGSRSCAGSIRLPLFAASSRQIHSSSF